MPLCDLGAGAVEGHQAGEWALEGPPDEPVKSLRTHWCLREDFSCDREHQRPPAGLLQCVGDGQIRDGASVERRPVCLFAPKKAQDIVGGLGVGKGGHEFRQARRYPAVELPTRKSPTLLRDAARTRDIRADSRNSPSAVRFPPPRPGHPRSARSESSPRTHRVRVGRRRGRPPARCDGS